MWCCLGWPVSCPGAASSSGWETGAGRKPFGSLGQILWAARTSPRRVRQLQHRRRQRRAPRQFQRLARGDPQPARHPPSANNLNPANSSTAGRRCLHIGPNRAANGTGPIRSSGKQRQAWRGRALPPLRHRHRPASSRSPILGRIVWCAIAIMRRWHPSRSSGSARQLELRPSWRRWLSASAASVH